MLKYLTFGVLFSILFVTNSYAQADSFDVPIKDNPRYLRQVNHLWAITNAFSKIQTDYEKQSSKLETTIKEQEQLIAKLLRCSNDDYTSLQSAYPNEKDFKDIEELRDALEKCFISLREEEWRSEPTWVLITNIVQMQLEDLTTKSLCI